VQRANAHALGHIVFACHHIVSSLLQLYDQTTSQLVSLYNQQKGKNDLYLNPQNIGKILLLRAIRNDDEAKQFLAKLNAADHEQDPGGGGGGGDDDSVSLKEVCSGFALFGVPSHSSV
jgi:hypothetical protein